MQRDRIVRDDGHHLLSLYVILFAIIFSVVNSQCLILKVKNRLFTSKHNVGTT